jgi:membrane protein required for colicin V production
VLAGTGQWLISMLPDDPESTILNKLKRPKPGDNDSPDTPPSDQHSQSADPADKPAAGGYAAASRVAMGLFEASGMAR